MKSNGLKKGDRVAAYLPNIPEAVIAYISTSVVEVFGLLVPQILEQTVS